MNFKRRTGATGAKTKGAVGGKTEFARRMRLAIELRLAKPTPRVGLEQKRPRGNRSAGRFRAMPIATGAPCRNNARLLQFFLQKVTGLACHG
jgi:hypothetical protein